MQGVGDDFPILQWLPVIKRIQAAGKGVVVDVQLSELEPFIAAMKPDGLYLCIPAEESFSRTSSSGWRSGERRQPSMDYGP